MCAVYGCRVGVQPGCVWCAWAETHSQAKDNTGGGGVGLCVPVGALGGGGGGVWGGG